MEYGFKEITEAKVAKFKKEVYDPYLTALSEHLDSRFPDVALLEAFSIFSPSLMKGWHPPMSSLFDKVEILTDHYSPHHITDPLETIQEYQCFFAAILSSENLSCLTTHDLMAKLTTDGQLKGHY